MRYKEVRQLHEQGVSVVGIAETLKLSPMTVYRYLRSEGFCTRLRPQGALSGSALMIWLLHQKCGRAAFWGKVQY